MIIRGINLETHFDILWKTPTAMAARALGQSRPEMQIKFRSNSQRRMGVSWPWQNRFILYVRPQDDWPELVATMCHEFAHVLRVPQQRGHNRIWKRTFATLAKEAYGLDITPYRLHMAGASDSLHVLLKRTIKLAA